MLLSLLLLGPAAQAGPPADLDRLFPRMGDVTDVHFGDLEPDGDLDAAVATHAGVYVVRQIATGRFELEGDPLPDTGLGDFSEGGVHLFDADGDGDLDVFVGKPGQDRLFRNDGPLGFADASGQVVSAIVSPHDLDSGDLDGDGDLDLYLVYGDGGGELLRNQGGSFTAEPITGIADLVRLADVDGDGDLDGVRARRGSCDPYSCWPGSAALALNDGTGSFVPAFFPSAEVWASDLAVGDMDGDGDPDVAISSYLGYPSLLFQNLGAGLFTSFPLPAVPISGRGVALPDVDSDGDLDVFFTGDGAPGGTEEILLLNTGAGLVNGSSRLPATPGREAGRAYVFDVDGDGDDDVVVEDTSPRVLLKGADARLVDVTPWAQAELATSAAVALGDLDGDGFADGVRGLGNTLSLLTNDGTGDLSPSVLASVTPFPSQDWTVALADVDGDGDLDAHSSVTSSDDSLHANDGAANLAPLPGALPVGFKSDGLTFFDADGDGDQDAAAPGLPNQLLVNAGPGTFTLLAEAQFPAGTGVARDAAAADFDLDGDLDLVFIGNSVGALYRNVGAGWTVDPTPLPEVDHGVAVAAGDVDLDGDPDVLLGKGSYSAANLVLLGDGTGGFAASTFLPATFGWPVAILADLDVDGDLDAVTERVWANDGTGFVESMPPPLHDSGVNVAAPTAVADLDGDGDLDVLFDGVLELRTTARQLAWRTPAAIGRTVGLDLYGTPGTPWLLGWSTGSAALAIPPLGTLQLDLASLVLAGVGSVSAGGVDAFDFPVPAQPALVGIELHWQAGVGSPFFFTNRTVTPILSL